VSAQSQGQAIYINKVAEGGRLTARLVRIDALLRAGPGED